MIYTTLMLDPPTRSPNTTSPRVPQPHGAVSTAIEQDVRVEPVDGQHFGAGVIRGVVGLERLDAIKRPGRLRFRNENRTVGCGDGEIGNGGVRAGRGGPEGSVRLGADDGGDVAGV